MLDTLIERELAILRTLSNQGLNAAEIERGYDKWLPAIAPKVFSHSFEWFHDLFFSWYWPLLKARVAKTELPEDTPRAGLLCLGRGLGKSAMLEGVALAEGAHFGRSFGLYVSSTKQKCAEHLQNVRGLIESSEVAHYYPGLAEPLVGRFGNQRGWKADALYTKSGFTLIAASLEQGVRGLRDLELRPTFIELDDIDERDDSRDVRNEKFETLTKDVIPMLAPFGLVLFAQNKIYDDSIMDATLKRKLDWLHLRHEVGVINTFQDDLEIEKIDGRPVIVCGTPNWSRIDRRVAQDILNKAGEDAFWRECQNVTSPPAEKLVWTGFSESLHVITWEEFEGITGYDRIPSGWELYGGYDAGTTGPECHPAVFVVAAVAAESSSLRDNIFIVYEYVAAAGEDEGVMAESLIAELPNVCGHYPVREAAALLQASHKDTIPERVAMEMRKKAGALIPFKTFRGSHEASSERRTFVNKYGLGVTTGKASKTEGLSQLRFYLKPERRPHPFKKGLKGKPGMYLVVSNDQGKVPRDRFGLERLRWEAANLRWDPNITARDVPMKFGDDATDCVKHICGNFKVGAPLTDAERLETMIPVELQQGKGPESTDWSREGWELARHYAVQQAQKKLADRTPVHDDPWKPRSPLANVDGSDPWATSAR